MIAKEVAAYYNLTLDDINKKNRSLKYREPRQIAHRLCWELVPRATLSKIGSIIGQKDHATVRHSRITIERLVSNYPNVKKDYDTLYELIKFKFEHKENSNKVNLNLRKQRNLISARKASIRHKMPLRIELIYS